MTFKTDDVRIKGIHELAPPSHLTREFPVTDRAATTVYEARQAIQTRSMVFRSFRRDDGLIDIDARFADTRPGPEPPPLAGRRPDLADRAAGRERRRQAASDGGGCGDAGVRAGRRLVARRGAHRRGAHGSPHGARGSEPGSLIRAL